MNIIFGGSLELIPDSYTILELDTVRFRDGNVQTAYCIVETIPLAEFPLAEAHKKIHHDLLEAYRNQHWNYCRQAIDGLTGKWGGELDTFYTALVERIDQLEKDGVPEGWDGTISNSV